MTVQEILFGIKTNCVYYNLKENYDYILKVYDNRYIVYIPLNNNKDSFNQCFGLKRILFHCVCCEEKYYKMYYNDYKDIDYVKIFIIDSKNYSEFRSPSNDITFWFKNDENELSIKRMHIGNNDDCYNSENKMSLFNSINKVFKNKYEKELFSLLEIANLFDNNRIEFLKLYNNFKSHEN